MKHELEIISHDNANYKFFLVNMLYRTTHFHKDYEIGVVLKGQVTVTSAGNSTLLSKGDFWLMNRFQIHEIKADRPTLLLALQVSSAFFASYYPQIEHLEFSSSTLVSPTFSLCRDIVLIALTDFRKEEFYELICASLINDFFIQILKSSGYHYTTEQERSASKSKAKRVRIITDYIDAHYAEKLLLSDLAANENLTLSYLSHFVKDNFGTTFQNYLLRVRCEKAQQLLLLTELSLLDIWIYVNTLDTKS